MNSSLLSGRLKGEGEIADSRPSGPGTQNGGTDMQYRLLRFGLTGIEHAFAYGANYRMEGQGFTTPQDQASREVWGEWHTGLIRFKTSLTERWNNIEKDPRRPRVMGTQGKTTMLVTMPAWPELMISYARDSSWSPSDLSGVPPQRNFTETVEAALFYAKPTWNARLLSAYSLS